MIRNSSLGSLRRSTLPSNHTIESFRVSWEETFCFFETWRHELGWNPRSPTFQAGSFNHCTSAPAHINTHTNMKWLGYCVGFRLLLVSVMDGKPQSVALSAGRGLCGNRVTQHTRWLCRYYDKGLFVKMLGYLAINIHGHSTSSTRIHWPKAGLILGRRRRRRANINPALGQCVVFAGTSSTRIPPGSLHIQCFVNWRRNTVSWFDLHRRDFNKCKCIIIMQQKWYDCELFKYISCRKCWTRVGQSDEYGGNPSWKKCIYRQDKRDLHTSVRNLIWHTAHTKRLRPNYTTTRL